MCCVSTRKVAPYAVLVPESTTCYASTPEMAESFPVNLHDLEDDLADVVAAERMLERQHLVQDAAERPDITLLVIS